MLEYLEQVEDYLEYIGYPYWIQMYEPEDVAKSLAGSIKVFYAEGWNKVSPRMAALAIFGLTFEMQILKTNESEIKH